MKLNVESTLKFPRDVVYRTYRDRLVELVPFLPNIRGISVQSRKDEPPITHIVNVWKGGGDIPAAARAVLSEKMLSWTDHARWDESQWTCEWRMEAHSFVDAVHAQGVNRFIEVEGGCRLVIEGELSIDGRKLPIPRLLAGTVGPAVEKFLGGMIRPNLTEVARGVVKFLEAEAAKKG
jgi:hypothetical protein